MIKCYLSLGSNQKFPERQIRQAFNTIKMMPSTSIIKYSKLHWTKAWGLNNQQNFCNAVVEIVTLLTPIQLLHQCQKIENVQGRVRKKTWGPRTLDIDIILYGNRSVKSKHLTIPHPHFLSRDFVLIPLLEVGWSLGPVDNSLLEGLRPTTCSRDLEQ
jgi:2-amino-4-hydroxy-6-hydroxymethyldihydropteridine diphosphokinase